MTAIFSVILSFYCLLLLAFLFGWVRVRRQSMPPKGHAMPGFSVVVAVRNEADNIQNLVNDLALLAYPPEKFEVILVNDHSTDATDEKIRSMLVDFSSCRLLRLPEGNEGKKAALQLGIAAARFEIIVTTDAD